LLPGPNSEVAKFSNNFCARCSTERSQPFDRAYDTVIEWFLRQKFCVGVTAVDDPLSTGCSVGRAKASEGRGRAALVAGEGYAASRTAADP
jgi:hypothetical protein